MNQLVATKLLTSMGVALDIADNDNIVLEKLAHNHYDLIFMDCQMPELDGYAATKKIRQLPPYRCKVNPQKIPIIALTVDIMTENINRCREAGMDDHLSKPFTSADIHSTLSKWLE